MQDGMSGTHPASQPAVTGVIQCLPSQNLPYSCPFFYYLETYANIQTHMEVLQHSLPFKIKE